MAQVIQGSGRNLAEPGPGWRLRGRSAIPASEEDDIFDPINFGILENTI